MGYGSDFMNVYQTNLQDALAIEGHAVQDNRGAFSRLFCLDELQSIIGDRKIVQINHSMTHRIGTIRGLHYQKPPHAEMKVVRCLRGRVFDVAVDLRQRSSHFKKWTAIELTPENQRALVIPEGFAHGFQVLEEGSELLYLHTTFYTPEAEGAIRFNDPLIGVNWPLSPIDISSRDLNHPLIDEDFEGLFL